MDALLEPVPLFKGQDVKPGEEVAAFSLARMRYVEAAASAFWNSLSPVQRRAYLKAHPKSKYGRSGTQSERHVDTKTLHSHMRQIGWIKTPTHWEHPKSRNKLVFGKSPTHKHLMSVTHPNGNIKRYKTNSDLAAMRTVTKLAKVDKARNSGIGNVLGEKKGSLHKHLGVPHGHPLPLGQLERLANSNHPLAGRARLVLNLKRARKRGPINYAAPKG